jgi:hypothetical protein
MKALCMLLEFGSNTDKQKAKQELYKIALPEAVATAVDAADDSSATCSN